MRETKKSSIGDVANEKETTEKPKTADTVNGTNLTANESGPKSSCDEQNEIQSTVSLTPFPNIDQVKSDSTNLIDSSAKQLHVLMQSISKTVELEENLFKEVNKVNAVCNCAKQIASLLRVKLDIYKEYKRSFKAGTE